MEIQICKHYLNIFLDLNIQFTFLETLQSIVHSSNSITFCDSVTCGCRGGWEIFLDSTRPSSRRIQSLQVFTAPSSQHHHNTEPRCRATLELLQSQCLAIAPNVLLLTSIPPSPVAPGTTQQQQRPRQDVLSRAADTSKTSTRRIL
jgi:hypothetical protein